MQAKITLTINYDNDVPGDKDLAIAFLKELDKSLPSLKYKVNLSPKKTKKSIIVNYPNTFKMYKLICKQEKLLPMSDLEANEKINLLVQSVGLKSTHVYFNFLIKHRMNDIATEREFFPTLSSASAIFTKFSSIVQAIKRERRENRSIFDNYERRAKFDTMLKNAGIIFKDGEYAP